MIKDRPTIDAGLFQALHDPQGYGKYFEIVRAMLRLAAGTALLY